MVNDLQEDRLRSEAAEQDRQSPTLQRPFCDQSSTTASWDVMAEDALQKAVLPLTCPGLLMLWGACGTPLPMFPGPKVAFNRQD